MTLTLVARNPFTRQVAVAIASGSDDCAGGSLYMRAGAGIISVQAKGNPQTGAAALEMLEKGAASADILAALAAQDKQLDLRQVLIAPLDGDIAACTGRQCLQWAGHAVSAHHAVAGNMLASKKVIDAMEKAYLADLHAPLRWRLFSALQAGIAAGGDLRGHRSAGIFILGEKPFSLKIVENGDVLAALEAGLAGAA
jgi:uncharacterized Ntn-hydrolase superfamily protein